jgi:hypothetical protein
MFGALSVMAGYRFEAEEVMKRFSLDNQPPEHGMRRS